MIEANIDLSHYKTIIQNHQHQIIADEPQELGGENLGFSPYELLESALGACTSITLRMYADRKQWDLKAVKVKVNLQKNADNTTTIKREIALKGNLDEVQKERLFSVANACPVHKVLSNPISLETSWLTTL
jgi:putative redox protein